MQVMRDLKALSATVRPPKPCTAAEKRELLVGTAKASLAAHKAEETVVQLSQEVRQKREAFLGALAMYENGLATVRLPAEMSHNTSAGMANAFESYASREREADVIAADAEFQWAKAALAAAVRCGSLP